MPGYGIDFEGTLAIGHSVVRIERDGRRVYYERISPEGIVKKSVIGCDSISFYPLYPVTLPELFTTYILVEFARQIDLAPEEETTVFTIMPVDVAVYSFTTSGVFDVVDVFSVKKIKYALYGPPDAGTIARYYRANVWNEMREPSVGEALMKISVRNKAKEWVTITCVLIESNPLTLFYREGTWSAYTQELSLVASSPKTGLVYYGKPFIEGAKPVADPPKLKQPVIHFRTDMLWGI